MITSKYPKAKAFLDSHPNMTVDEAIRFLDFQLKQIRVSTDTMPWHKTRTTPYCFNAAEKLRFNLF